MSIICTGMSLKNSHFCITVYSGVFLLLQKFTQNKAVWNTDILFILKDPKKLNMKSHLTIISIS